MQGSSSTTNTDINSKVEDVFTYTSSNSKKSRLQSMLSALLSDPILSDVPKKPTIADVDTLISLELGSAMKILVMRMDNTSFDVAMPNSATVKDLKQAIKKKIEEIEEGQMGHRHISWKHVWANFCLSHHNEKLIDDNSLLQDYGIRNNSQLQFYSSEKETLHSGCIEEWFVPHLGQKAKYKISSSGRTCRCILHPVLRHGYHKSTLGERNIASFMALASSRLIPNEPAIPFRQILRWANLCWA